MTALARVGHLVRADFLERTRRYGFLVVMGLTLWAGYQMVPPLDAPYNAFSIGGHRPYYSSAWVGTIFGTICGTLLTLIGFFLIRNSVGRDRETRVGRIIAGTPTGRVPYVVGKWLSNLAVLAAILAVLTLVAPLMQLLRGEDRQLDLVALMASLWLIGLPPLALVAALAVLFETTPGLRGAFGSVVFAFLWIVVLVFPVGSAFMAKKALPPVVDVVGLSPSMASLYATAEAAGIDVDAGVTDLFEPTGGRPVRRFVWKGIAWPPGVVGMRFVWIAIALGVATAAALPFDRFDPARGRVRRPRRKLVRRSKRKRGPPEPEAVVPVEAAAPAVAEHRRLTPLDAVRARGRLRMLVATELRLMFRGRPWWWWGAVIVVVVTMLAALGRLRLVPPVLWLLPVGIWSAMGSREARSGTTALVFSTPRPLERQLAATWLAGVIVALAVAALTAISAMAAGRFDRLIGVAFGVAFVPALALALGTLTGSNRAFEVVYIVVWYLGVLGRLTPLDFLGVSQSAVEASVPFYYGVAAVVLLGLAVVGRRRQLRQFT